MIIPAVISALILLYLAGMINFSLVASKLETLEIPFLALSLLLVFVVFIMRSYIFKKIIDKDKKNISFSESLRLNLIGSSLNIILPANIGDIAKSYFGFKRTNLKEGIVSASIFDLAISLAAVFLIGAFSSLFFNFYYSLIFMLLFFMLMTLFLNKLLPKIISRYAFNLINLFFLNKLERGKFIASFLLPFKLKVQLFLLSILSWILLYSQFYFICKMFALDVTLSYILTIGPLLALAKLFPLTFNGLGSREAVVIYFFNIIGISPSLAALASLTYYALNLLPGLIGIPLLFKKNG